MKILFVCTNNAGRSQMSETFFRNLCGNNIEIYSAGVDPWPAVHPAGAALMKEQGLSMSGQRPKHVDIYKNKIFDYVVTIGEPAKIGIPEFPGNPHYIHWEVNDPALAKDAKPEDVFKATFEQLKIKLVELYDITKAEVSHSE